MKITTPISHKKITRPSGGFLTLNGGGGKSKLQIVATRGILPFTAVSVAGISLHESRDTCKTGPANCSNLRIVTAGFSVSTAAGAGEQNLVNDITVLGAIEKLSPDSATMVTYGGQPSAAFKSGTMSMAISDPVPGVSLSASEIFKLQYEARFAAGGMGLAALNFSVLADTFRSTLLTGQIGAIGAWSSAGRSTNFNIGTHVAVLGIPDIAFPSVLLLGDSIEADRDDSVGDAFGDHGFVPQGLYASGPGGVAIPYSNCSVSGEIVASVSSGTLWMYRLSMGLYASHFITNLGRNSITSFATAQMQIQYLAAWARMRVANPAVKIYQCKIIPACTSSNSFVDAAGQTPLTGYALGGVRDQLNTWFDTQVGLATGIDGTMDPNPYCEDQSNLSKWVTNGTAFYPSADGTHPSSALHALMQAAVAAKAANFNVTSLCVGLGGSAGT